VLVRLFGLRRLVTSRISSFEYCGQYILLFIISNILRYLIA
jgi:hypothetical protein